MHKNWRWLWIILGGILLFSMYLGYSEQTDRPITDLLIDKETRVETSELASLNHLILGANKFGLRVDSSLQSYYEWIYDVKTGPSGTEGMVNGIAEIKGFYEWQVDFERQYLPLDIQYSAFDFEQKTGELQSLVSDLHTYYLQKQYREDNWSRGQIMHDPLRTAHTDFKKAQNRLMSALEGNWRSFYFQAVKQLEEEDQPYRAALLKHTFWARESLNPSTDYRAAQDSLFLSMNRLSALRDQSSFKAGFITGLEEWESALLAYELCIAAYWTARMDTERYPMNAEMKALSEARPELLYGSMDQIKTQWFLLAEAYRKLGFGKHHLYMLHPPTFFLQ